MFCELVNFAQSVLFQKSIWKDGELWSSIAGGVGAYFWFRFDPEKIEKVRQHFNDLLSATSIVFGLP